VWKEVADGVWHPAWTSPPALHTASVNACAFAPHELGLLLAAGSSDGGISFTSCGPDGGWSSTKVERAHLMGVTSVSWAPPTPPGSLVAAGSGAGLVRRLVTGGCDNAVKVWTYAEGRGWVEESLLRGHSDWVRDVAWAPNLGMPRNTIASAGQDGKVLVWTQSEPAGAWTSTQVVDLRGTPVWRVSWSAFGNVLAVADGSNNVTLWKEATDGKWVQLAEAPEPGTGTAGGA
jgi:protein transport protein SEC13